MSDRLPAGVRVTELETHADDRGALTEVFRPSWGLPILPRQWNVTTSGRGVLRGVHVHLRRSDYLLVARGSCHIGLRDIRRASATEGLGVVVELSDDRPRGLTIPPGVLHGFYFPGPALTIVGFSDEHQPEDDLECHWADPDLGIPWQTNHVVLSERDRAAPPLSDLLARLEPRQPIGGGRRGPEGAGGAPSTATPASR